MKKFALAALAMLCWTTFTWASARSWQPLILKGSELPQLLGAREDRFEMLAVHDGKLVPIPFQVDEVLPDGRYALPHGMDPVKDDRPGIFDRDDQIAVMLSDLGVRAQSSALPKAALEIQVADPLGGPDRYAYIAAVDKPARSTVRYIHFDPARDTIKTSYYRIGMTGGWPTDFALRHGIEADPPNLIDRFKVRTTARILGLFSYHMNENDVRSTLLGWKVGPVRMIRRERHSVNIFLGVHSPGVHSQVFLYRNFMENPTKVNFPWIPRLIFTWLHVRVDVDYIGLHNFELSWQGMKEAPIAVGSQSVAEKALEHERPGPQAKWVALRGDGRIMIQTLKPSPDLAIVHRYLYYRYSNTPDPPEKYPGQHPGIGYMTTGWRNLSSGAHVVDSYFVIANGSYSPARFLKELATPPRVTVRQVK
ncbi:MAG: hypothetical protein ACREQ4_13785 [Candidatus Binataceae bacterium]